MTETANIERQRRRQAEFVTDEQQRLLEIEDMRLVVKFGEKKRYSDRETALTATSFAPLALEVFKPRHHNGFSRSAKKTTAPTTSSASRQCRARRSNRVRWPRATFRHHGPRGLPCSGGA
jgi:hypothetical protein